MVEITIDDQGAVPFLPITGSVFDGGAVLHTPRDERLRSCDGLTPVLGQAR